MATKNTCLEYVSPSSGSEPDDSLDMNEINSYNSLNEVSEIQDIDEVFDSDEPVRLAVEIEKYIFCRVKTSK